MSDRLEELREALFGGDLDPKMTVAELGSMLREYRELDRERHLAEAQERAAAARQKQWEDEALGRVSRAHLLFPSGPGEPEELAPSPATPEEPSPTGDDEGGPSSDWAGLRTGPGTDNMQTAAPEGEPEVDLRARPGGWMIFGGDREAYRAAAGESEGGDES